MLAGSTSGIVEREVGVGEMKWFLEDDYGGRLSGLDDKLVCHFKLAADMVRGGVREFINYAS